MTPQKYKTPKHTCREIARIRNMDIGRQCWMGELISVEEKFQEWEKESYCVHLTTPRSGERVIFMNISDLVAFAGFFGEVASRDLHPLTGKYSIFKKR